MSDLALVCCHFNPCNYQSRQDNLLAFITHLRAQRLPLIVAELSIGGAPFTLPMTQGVIRFHATDVLWHKERLLNLAIRCLPRRFTKVAWLDADVIFPDADWYGDATRMLDRHKIIQLFERVVQKDNRGQPRSTVMGVASYVQAGGKRPFKFDTSNTWPGLAWAARRDLFNSIELLDCLVVGGSDTYMCLAAYGQFAPGHNWHVQLLNSSLREHYLAWAERFYSEINGDVGYLPITITQLGHGARACRQYVERFEILRRHNFNPGVDLAGNNEGVWEWSSDKREMHSEVAAYFAKRDEDSNEP